LTARYDILGEVGRGGMGIVYKARDRETGELVALKVLKPEIAADQTAMERFKNELRLARKITHKNVCRIHELLRFGDTVAIAMEYVEGQSLRAVLQSPGGVALGRALDWLGKICAALAEAHTQGVVHRDLKPENILLMRDGTVKLADFGIARDARADATGITHGPMGTLLYMSPEQVRGLEVDARSDLYAAGVVFHQVLAGRFYLPIAGKDDFQVRQLILRSPARLQGTPAGLRAFLQRTLAKDPARRFGTAADMRRALRGAAPLAPAP
jgi:serine/threonine-protein kinase